MAFIDFRKAFDSIDRGKMFQILNAYGIPLEVVDAIKVMHEDTSALVITPEGETNMFSIDTGVLQGDPLAPSYLSSAWIMLFALRLLTQMV